MEVEELTPKEILKILNEKVPTEKIMEEKEKASKKLIPVPNKVIALASELKETLEAVILDKNLEPIERIPVSELAVKLQQVEGGHTLIFDGIVTQRLVDIAADKGLERIVGDRISGLAKRPINVQLLSADEITAEVSA